MTMTIFGAIRRTAFTLVCVPSLVLFSACELEVSNHMQNFFDCMRSRKPPNLNADFGYRAMVAIGMGVDAYRESRQLAFDPATERLVKAAAKRDGYEGTGKNVDESKPS